MLKVYSKTVCPKCMALKRDLHREGIEFEDINIEHDEKAMKKIVEAGLSSLPTVELADETLVSGYEQVLQALNIG